MGLRFIFMLTRNDRTVEDAATQLDTALALGVRHTCLSCETSVCYAPS